MSMLAILAIIAAEVVFFSLLLHSIRKLKDDSWEYLIDPNREERYIIRLESGFEAEADFIGDSWYDLDGHKIDRSFIECWKEI